MEPGRTVRMSVVIIWTQSASICQLFLLFSFSSLPLFVHVFGDTCLRPTSTHNHECRLDKKQATRMANRRIGTIRANTTSGKVCTP